MMGMNVVMDEWCCVGMVLCWNDALLCVIVLNDIIVSEKQG